MLMSTAWHGRSERSVRLSERLRMCLRQRLLLRVRSSLHKGPRQSLRLCLRLRLGMLLRHALHAIVALGSLLLALPLRTPLHHKTNPSHPLAVQTRVQTHDGAI